MPRPLIFTGSAIIVCGTPRTEIISSKMHEMEKGALWHHKGTNALSPKAAFKAMGTKIGGRLIGRPSARTRTATYASDPPWTGQFHLDR
jgi:hypothetical protein